MTGTKNKIEDLRNHLFATLEELRDKDVPLEQSVARAKSVADVARVVIESAKVEVDFARVTGNTLVSGFLPEGEKPVPGPRRLGAGRAR